MKIHILKFFIIRFHKKLKKALIVTAFPLGLTLGIVMALSISMLTSVSHAGIITDAFSGGDVGEGLDFQGNFDYAVDVSGTGGTGVAIDDAYFTNDSVAGVTVSADWSNDNWHHANYGNSANDDALENIMSTIRWSNKALNAISINLADLIIGNTYSLQLLFAESTSMRGFDITLGPEVLDNFAPYLYQGGINNTSKGAVVRYDFTAISTVLNIGLGGDAPYADNTPILNAFTLENTNKVSEPSSLTIILIGFFAIGAGRLISEQTRHG